MSILEHKGISKILQPNSTTFLSQGTPRDDIKGLIPQRGSCLWPAE